MTAADPRYDEGYWERGEGSNYVDYGPDPGFNLTAQVMCRVAPPPATLLEVGCAKGFFLAEAQEAGYHVAGCDVSEWALDHADGRVLSHVLLASVTDLPFAGSMFEITCSWEVLEHVYPDEIDQAFKEMIRVTVPGGWMIHRIGMLMDGEDMSHHFDDHTHVLNEDRDWWLEKFEEHHLVIDDAATSLFNRVFIGRDWCGRFIASRVTTNS